MTLYYPVALNRHGQVVACGVSHYGRYSEVVTEAAQKAAERLCKALEEKGKNGLVPSVISQDGCREDCLVQRCSVKVVG